MKSFNTIIVCSLIGGAIGLATGIGESRYTKKSQRQNTFPVFAIGGLIIGAIGGLIVSNSIIQEDKDTKTYGFNEMKTFEHKVGRKWTLYTIWSNPMTGTENKIVTEYNSHLDSVLTHLNDVSIFNHNSPSGSKQFVQKVHLSSVQEIKKKIKNGELHLI